MFALSWRRSRIAGIRVQGVERALLPASAGGEADASVVVKVGLSKSSTRS